MALVTMPFWRDFRWAASTTVDFEKAAVTDIANQTTRGKAMVIEPAGDLQYEHKRFRVDVSAGAAVPFGTGVGTHPWPEAKAVVKYRPIQDLELTATGAYKGRVPSLRERFDPVNGNPDLRPERIVHAELRAVEHVNDLVHLEVAPYYKHSTGTIVASQDPNDLSQLVNLGVVNYWGVDTMARVTPHPMVELGGGYSYIKARSITTSGDMVVETDASLQRLPHHRWLRRRPSCPACV
jgi:outer membrane cobalamin receptor